MTKFNTRKHQSGAALVVGLILLVAITLMAISSMSTASLDLIMAGNEQYHTRAFHAAESGIEQAWLNDGAFTTSADYPWTAATPTGTGSDAYRYTVTRPNAGAVQSSPPGNSSGSFGAVYFSITSTGNSERGAQATNTQELFEVVKAPDDVVTKDCGTTDLYDTGGSTC